MKAVMNLRVTQMGGGGASDEGPFYNELAHMLYYRDIG
jgi:hypothetical protein